MSQTKNAPKLVIRNKTPGLSTGMNVEVFLDDKKLTTLSFLKIELKAKRVAKVMMEMYVELDVEMEAHPEIRTIED